MLRRIPLWRMAINHKSLSATPLITTRSYVPCESFDGLACVCAETKDMEKNIGLTQRILSYASSEPFYQQSGRPIEDRIYLALRKDYHPTINDKIQKCKEASDKHTEETYRKNGDYARRLLYDEKDTLANKIMELKCCEYHSLLTHVIHNNSLDKFSSAYGEEIKDQLRFHHKHRLEDLKFAFREMYPAWYNKDGDGEVIDEENFVERVEKASSLYRLYHRMKDNECNDIKSSDFEFWDREESHF